MKQVAHCNLFHVAPPCVVSTRLCWDRCAVFDTSAVGLGISCGSRRGLWVGERREPGISAQLILRRTWWVSLW